MANQPTLLTTFTLATLSTGIVDLATFMTSRPNFRVELTYDSAPTGNAYVDMTDGFGGYKDPAIPYPWVQPVPFVVSTDGTHLAGTVAWNRSWTNFPLSPYENSGQMVTISFSRMQSLPPWQSIRVANLTDVSCRVDLYFANQSY